MTMGDSESEMDDKKYDETRENNNLTDENFQLLQQVLEWMEQNRLEI